MNDSEFELFSIETNREPEFTVIESLEFLEPIAQVFRIQDNICVYELSKRNTQSNIYRQVIIQGCHWNHPNWFH